MSSLFSLPTYETYTEPFDYTLYARLERLSYLLDEIKKNLCSVFYAYNKEISLLEECINKKDIDLQSHVSYEKKTFFRNLDYKIEQNILDIVRLWQQTLPLDDDVLDCFAFEADRILRNHLLFADNAIFATCYMERGRDISKTYSSYVHEVILDDTENCLNELFDCTPNGYFRVVRETLMTTLPGSYLPFIEQKLQKLTEMRSVMVAPLSRLSKRVEQLEETRYN